jgi:hypothetical protein
VSLEPKSKTLQILFQGFAIFWPHSADVEGFLIQSLIISSSVRVLVGTVPSEGVCKRRHNMSLNNLTAYSTLSTKVFIATQKKVQMKPELIMS